MTTAYIDAHCHLQFEQYDADREEIIEAMREQGVAGIVVGCDEVSSVRAVELAEKHEHLFAAVGQHPNHTGHSFSADAFRNLAKRDTTVAIGECGLDYFRPADVNPDVQEKQKKVFREHVQLAVELDKPLIIHARPSKGTMDAYQDVITVLQEAKKESPTLRGDIHFFVGGIAEAEALIALGFTLSFTAVITFARDYDAVIRAIPLSSILAETDSPYVAPLARRGQRNDPLAVIDVVQKIAEIRGEPVELVRETVAESTKRLFALPPAV